MHLGKSSEKAPRIRREQRSSISFERSTESKDARTDLLRDRSKADYTLDMWEQMTCPRSASVSRYSHTLTVRPSFYQSMAIAPLEESGVELPEELWRLIITHVDALHPLLLTSKVSSLLARAGNKNRIQ